MHVDCSDVFLAYSFMSGASPVSAWLPTGSLGSEEPQYAGASSIKERRFILRRYTELNRGK